MSRIFREAVSVAESGVERDSVESPSFAVFVSQGMVWGTVMRGVTQDVMAYAPMGQRKGS